MYWDVHCHITDNRLNENLEEILAEAATKGIYGFAQGGYEPQEWMKQLEIIKRFPQYTILPVFGLHPMWVSQAEENELEDALSNLLRQSSKASAIGEIGLDGRKEFNQEWLKQTEAFRSQLEIAGMMKKPIVLHVVRAHSEALQQLLLHRELIHGGFVHSFTGDWDTAKQYLDLNLLISIGGALTHPRGESLRELVRNLPKESFLLETDSPDQKISGWNKPNHHPVSLVNIAELVATLRNETVETILKQNTENFRRAMNLI